MSSIKDVARLAGVSYTTVSHVINGTRRVSDVARQRVLQAISDSGYVPSAAARALRGGKAHILGALVPDISNPFCAELMLGLEKTARRAGYSLLLCSTDLDADDLQQQIDSLIARRVDGLVVVAGGFDSSRVTQVLKRSVVRARMPLLLLDRNPTDLRCDALLAHQYDAAREATRHLLALGHRRIACLSGPANLSISQERVAGWRAALAEARVEPEPAWLAEGDFSLESGHQQGAAWLRQGRVTAVFASNDLMALGVLRAAAQLGVPVPQRLSVIGMDGIDLGRYTHPALTTVGSSLQRVGQEAADMLLHRIQHPDLPLQKHWRTMAVVQRESTGRAPELGAA